VIFLVEEKYYEIIPENKQKKNFSYMQSERRRINNEISKLLSPNVRKIQQHYMFAVVKLDRLVDRKNLPDDFFLHCEKLAKEVWRGRLSLTQNKDELVIVKLTNYFKKLPNKEYIFQKFSEHLINVDKDISRRWRILSAKELKEIQIGVSEPWAKSYLGIILPDIQISDIEKLAKYGLPVKIADDLNDIWEDVPLGFVNVPIEHINKIEGIEIENNRLKKVYIEKLKIDINYVKSELQRARILYEDVDIMAEKISTKNPEYSQLVGLWKDFCHGWFKEAKTKYNLDF